jgi:restriction system protein
MVFIEPILKRSYQASHARSPIADRVRSYEGALSVYWDEYEKKRREIESNHQAQERTRQETERIRIEQETERQRRLADYWLTLDGLAFERELGNLYRRLGYDVKTTPVTGDDGVDLVLKKDGLTTIVQCKSHQQPVGPAIAREIYGALISSKADNAILACTSGFTTGVFAFVRDKPISLVSAKEILVLVESATTNSA